MEKIAYGGLVLILIYFIYAIFFKRFNTAGTDAKGYESQKKLCID